MPHTDITGGEKVYYNAKIFHQRVAGLQKQHLNNIGFSPAQQTFVSLLCVKSNLCVVGGGENDQRMLTLMGV